MKTDPNCPVHGIGMRIGPARIQIGMVGWTTEAKCTCTIRNTGLIGTAISGGRIERHPKDRATGNRK